MTTDDVRSSPAAGLPSSFARVSLAYLMRSVEANLLGNIHGGEIVKLADTTAGAVGQRHCGGPAVTAALDDMAFLAPVHVGDIVRTYGQVNWAGRTSMEIGVRVEAQPWNDPREEAAVHVASAYFVFVAVDEDGAPRTVPSLILETEADRRRWREAEIRRAHRLARKADIASSREG